MSLDLPTKTQGRQARPRKPRLAPAPALADALADAAWREADVALAEALACADEAASAKTEQGRAAALALLQQALARAARKRGLARIGALGASISFDIAQHEPVQPIGPRTRKVRVLARGVSRSGEMLAKPRVGPLRPKR